MTAAGLVTVTLERGESTIVFKGVPAQVCENCGEQYVDERVTSDLLQQAQAAVGSGVQVEVRSFAA
jgi:YgiT-type zinc finger domain-containing protein